MTTTNAGTEIGAALELPVQGEVQSRGKAEEELQTILRTTLDGFKSVSPRGLILDVNQQYCDMLGYRREELLQMSLSDIVAFESQADIELRMQTIIHAGSRRFESCHRRKDGEVLQVEVSATHLPSSGNFFVFVRDITNRKRAEAALRQSLERLQKVLEVETVGVMFWDLNTGCMIDANNTFLELMGYTRSELEAGKLTWQRLTPPEFIDASRARVEKFLVTGRVGPYEKEYFRKDGRRQWLLFAGSSLGNNQCVEFCVDISDRKKAEQALRESQIKYRTVVEQIPQAIFQKDRQSVFVSCNDRYASDLGICAADIAGKTDFDFYPRRLAKKYRADDLRVIETGQTLQIEEEYVLHGEPRTVLTSKAPVIGENGEVIGVLGIFTDVTARKRAEERLHVLSSAVEQSPVSILITDCNGKIEYANRQACESTGYAFEELIGKNPRIFRSGETAPEEYRRLWETIRTGDWRGVFHNRRKNGELFWESATISPVRNQLGEIRHYLAVKEDITARRAVEAALRESEERFRIAAECTSDVIYDWDIEPGGAGIYGSAARLFGNSGEAHRRTYDDFVRLIHPDDRHRVVHEIERYVKSGERFRSEYRVVLENGEVRYWADQGRAMLDDAGKVRRWIGANTDITEQKLAAVSLAAEAVRRKILFEQSKDGVVIFDESGRAHEANLSFAKMLGYSMEELLQLDVSDWDAQLNKDQIEELMRHIRANPATFETVARRKDGTVFDVEVSSSAAELDGGVFFYAVCRDVSARKAGEAALRESEERFRLIAETIGEVFWVASADISKILYVSSAYERVWGRSCASLYENPRSWFDAIHPDDRDRINANIQAQKLGDPFDQEYRIVRPDGSLRWVWSRGFPVPAGPESAGRFVGVAADITDRKELQRQLTQAQKLESIGQLAAGIAHEINTPIQYIGDNGAFLKDAFRDLLRAIPPQPAASGSAVGAPCTTLPPAQEADVEYLREEIPKAIVQLLEGAGQVAHIVRAMKEFSHPGPAEKTPLDINRAIQSTILVSRNEWKYVAEVTTDLDAELPPVPCIAGEFNQVILNLVVNAAQAIEDVVKESGRKGAIQVSTRRKDEWAEIRVSDTGGGIPEAIRTRIFDPFFTTKRVGKGTGQGLAIAHAVVVQKHQGTIDFESQPGAGTTFVIRLPLGTSRGEFEENPVCG